MFTPRASSTRYMLMSAGDFVVATLVAYTCLAISGGVTHSTDAEYHLHEMAPLVGLLFVILMYFFDSYGVDCTNSTQSMFAILASSVLSLSGIPIIVALSSDRLLADGELYPIRLLASLTFTTFSLVLWRLALGHFAKNHVAHRVIICGNTQIAAALAREIEQRRYLGYRLVGFAHTDQVSHSVGESFLPEQSNGFACAMFSPDVLIAQGPPLTLVVDGAERLPMTPEQLLKMRAMGIGVNDCESFYEQITGKLPVGELRHSWLAFAPGYGRQRWRIIVKRTIDIVAGLALLVLTLPIAVVAAIALKLDSAGPIFYRQDRIGTGGILFRILKFRSMCFDAEAKTGVTWAAPRDPRVTAVGRVMRRLRIDELPQLLNVLKGDMSLVGPRPERPEIVARLIRTIPLYAHRHSMRPGITGWAQVCYPYGATVEDAKEKLCYDLYYVKNWSLLLDLQIMLQTLKVVIYGRGAR